MERIRRKNVDGSTQVLDQSHKLNMDNSKEY